MADLKLGYLAIDESIKGIRDDGTTRAPILLYDDATGDTIVRALDTGGTVLFQNAAGVPIAFPVAWAAITSKPTTIAGYAITDAYTEGEVDTLISGLSAVYSPLGHTHAGVYAPISHAHAGADITSGSVGPTFGGTGLTTYAAGDLIYASATNVLAKRAAGTNGHVLTLDTGLPVWAAPTGGVANAFATISNSAGTDQFTASGADELQFAAGADLSVAFDAGNKRVTFAFIGSLSGITRGYADITADSGTSAAAGADTLVVTGAGGITTAATSAPDTLTITLGNHSAALLTSGTVGTARLGSGTANSTTFLRGDNTWVAAGSTSASDLTSGNLAYARLPTGSGSWDAGVGNTTTFTRAVALSSTLAVTGVSTFSGNVVASVIRLATSDGSDNGVISINGGGGDGDWTRGAYLLMYGNEHGATGRAGLTIGNVTGAFGFLQGAGGVAFKWNHAGQIGFFDATPATKPTGVAVTAAGVHAALVTLGLIAA